MNINFFLSILHNFLHNLWIQNKKGITCNFFKPFYIFLQVIYLLYKVYYQPNKFTIYRYGAILIYFSKSSQILILSCVVFMWNPEEKTESFVQYMLHSFLRLENLCFWQSDLNVTYPMQYSKQSSRQKSIYLFIVFCFMVTIWRVKNALIVGV